MKWTDLNGIENTLEVYDGNTTSCVYSIENIPNSHTFHVMAHVVRQIPLEPVVGTYIVKIFSTLITLRAQSAISDQNVISRGIFTRVIS